MKNLTFLLVLVFIVTLCHSQEMAARWIGKNTMDLTARTNAVKDINNEVCAIIKIRTQQRGFSFDSHQIEKTEEKPDRAEIWVYTSWGIKKMTVMHPQFGVLRDFIFPENIEKECVYEMELITEREVTINSNPSGATLFIDNKPMGGTPVTRKLDYGEHIARLEYFGLSREQLIEVTAIGEGIIDLDFAKMIEAGKVVINTHTQQQTVINTPTQRSVNYNANIQQNNQLRIVVGDIYCRDGSFETNRTFSYSGKQAEGIVFYVDESGQHGWIVGLHEFQSSWSDEHIDTRLQNIDDDKPEEDMSGLSNTQSLDLFFRQHGLIQYLTKSVVSYLNNQWYIPSAGQLYSLSNVYNVVNPVFSIIGANDMSGWYWSSSEASKKEAYNVWISSGWATTENKKDELKVRLIKDF
ncbi:MAG: PEGA domain-containing protein [Bacteroidales bacterium]|nr:PEGA domain-containing protein [Bacteroidales bacterium]